MRTTVRRSPFTVSVVMFVAIFGVIGSTLVLAQSLGAVAKKEEERRKAVKSSGKVYTNDSIKGEPSAPPPASSSPAGQPAASSQGTSSPSAAPSDDEKKDEKYWRKRVQDERDGLQKAQSYADALQSQANGLWAEFTACAAPPQCTQLANRRQKALADLEQTKREIQAHTKALATIQDEARRAGVPAGWAR
jgi:K+-transporting ATPase c subunit